MRAREIIINVPIKINIDSESGVDVSSDAADDQETDSEVENPTMVYPLDQELELQKAALGKNSKVIDDLLRDE